MALPAFARADRAAIDRYLLPAGPAAANLQQRVCYCGPALGQRDGQTDGLIYRHILYGQWQKCATHTDPCRLSHILALTITTTFDLWVIAFRGPAMDNICTNFGAPQVAHVDLI